MSTSIPAFAKGIVRCRNFIDGKNKFIQVYKENNINVVNIKQENISINKPDALSYPKATRPCRSNNWTVSIFDQFEALIYQCHVCITLFLPCS